MSSPRASQHRLDALDHLRLIAEREAKLGDEWLLTGLRRMEANPGMGLDESLGLIAPGASWRNVESRRVRDQRIREIAERFFPESSGAAASIANEIQRYATRNWSCDQAFDKPPARYAGKADELLFLIFREGQAAGPIPTSRKQIARILDGTTPSPGDVRERVA